MHITNIQRLAIFINQVAMAVFGWLLHGFAAMDSVHGVAGCVLAMALIPCMTHNLLDD